MKAMVLAGGAVALTVLVAGPLLAGPERVPLPADFDKAYALYNAVDRPDRKRIRFMFVNPETHAKAKAGEPAPNGTVLIMADRAAKLGADGKAVLDADGRMIADGGFTSIFVMKKEAGWGATQPADMKNGDWDYASYKADGTLNSGDTKGCFACHNNRSGSDFTFTFSKNAGR